MNFYLYSSIHFEKWDWRNSVEKGIGGSETSHVEMAWRLARRGHNVTTYAPIPDDCPGEWRGTKWLPLEAATFTEPGIWIIYRDPSLVDRFPKKTERKDQTIWLLMQDWDYPNWTEERLKNCDKILAMCKWHARATVERHPAAKENLFLISNGIKTELIEETEKQNIVRNPKKIIYASSPDRGLKSALLSFKKAREYVDDLEFHCFYGFNNIDMLIKNPKNTYYRKLKEELMKLMDQPGVTWHGRVSQNELYQHWLSSGMWIYETNFAETSCITCMEAQAMGAIPIYNPVWAQGENIGHGIAIQGDPEDPLTQARYGAEMVRLATNPELQEQIRSEMIPWARKKYDWENFVDLWESLAGIREYTHEYPTQMTEEDYTFSL